MTGSLKPHFCNSAGSSCVTSYMILVIGFAIRDLCHSSSSQLWGHFIVQIAFQCPKAGVIRIESISYSGPQHISYFNSPFSVRAEVSSNYHTFVLGQINEICDWEVQIPRQGTLCHKNHSHGDVGGRGVFTATFIYAPHQGVGERDFNFRQNPQEPC